MECKTGQFLSSSLSVGLVNSILLVLLLPITQTFWLQLSGWEECPLSRLLSMRQWYVSLSPSQAVWQFLQITTWQH